MFKFYRSITGICLLCSLVASGLFSMTSAAQPAYADETITITTSSLSNGQVGAYYYTMMAATGGSGSYTWTIYSGNLPTGLNLSSTGVISGTPTTAATSSFAILCHDTASHETTKTFSIQIIPSSSSALTIQTTSMANGVVGAYYSATLSATGGSGPYTWALSSGSLPAGLILSSTGVISGTPTTATTLYFTVLCSDNAAHATTKTLSIYISSSSSTLTIATSSLANGVIGTTYSTALSATGGSGTYTWALSSGSLPAGLTLSSAGVISGTPTTEATYTFTVLCSDTASHSTTRTLSIYVSSTSSSSSSTLAISTTSLATGIVGTTYSTTLTATGGSGSYTWALSSGSLPSGLALNTSGAITGTPTVAAIYNFTIVCSDTAAHATTGTFTIYISSSGASTLAISTTSLSNGTIGAFYSATLAATGGSGTYTWALSSGSLPTGLTLSTSGIIFGTPTAASTSSFKVLVYDTDSHLATKTLSISISSVQAPTLAISTTSLSSGVVGVPYSATLTAINGSGTYTWALSTGSLPAGLTISSSGTISGTPTTAGTNNFTVLVYDTASNAITKALSILINPTLEISTSSLTNGTVDIQYSATLAATGGTSPYTWALSNGNLPAGLTLNTSGIISGTPAVAETYSFTVLVTDSNSLTANKALSITVSPSIPLSITTPSLAGGKTGANYSAALAASGGTNSYTWTLTDGSLPTGLTLSASGAISGTPTTAATYNFTITVTDTKSHTAIKTYSITIAAEAATTPSSNTTATKPSGATDGKPFDFTIPIIVVVSIIGLLIIGRIIWMVVKKKS